MKKMVVMKMVVVAMVLVMLLVPSVAQAASNTEVVSWVGDGEWYRNTWYVDLCPGERASIELKIKSSVDAVVYVEHDLPRSLFLYFDPPAFEIKKGKTELVKIVVYASGEASPGEYEIDFTFKAVETKIVYRDREVPKYIDREVFRYIDREVPVYVDREVPKYIYVGKGVDWWWIPISVVYSILAVLGASRLVRRYGR